MLSMLPLVACYHILSHHTTQDGMEMLMLQSGGHIGINVHTQRMVQSRVFISIGTHTWWTSHILTQHI